MNRIRKAFALVLMAVGLTVALAVPAQASPAASQATTYSQKAPIKHHDQTNCSSGAFPASGTTIGFARFKETATTVSVKFRVKDLMPNTLYGLSLVQTPSGEACTSPEATFTTDSKGRGHASYSETRLPGQTGAFVRLSTPGDSDSAVSTSVKFPMMVCV